ncbi:MAG: hypothetical protein VR67_17545 [Peptococcaceae bacterium BRH_c8a]|nr:MAG: hypothetical protein VR67_17545 [Peptococcaceae bacterium BRH_c8a]
MKNTVKKLWNDENGLTTMEIIIGTVLLGGAATLVGFALTSGFSGKTGDFVGDLEDLTAINDAIDDGSAYTYTSGTTGATGIMTDATGN